MASIHHNFRCYDMNESTKKIIKCIVCPLLTIVSFILLWLVWTKINVDNAYDRFSNTTNMTTGCPLVGPCSVNVTICDKFNYCYNETYWKTVICAQDTMDVCYGLTFVLSLFVATMIFIVCFLIKSIYEGFIYRTNEIDKEMRKPLV